MKTTKNGAAGVNAEIRRPLDEQEVRRLMREELRAMLAPLFIADTRANYTNRRGCGPAEYSDKAWKRIAPTIPGAILPSKETGRWIIVPRAAYEAWLASRATTPPLTKTAANDAPKWTAEGALRAAGLRPTR